MLVVTRHLVDPEGVSEFLAATRRALSVLAARPGWVEATLGHNVDDPRLWVLTTRWRDVGSYRRALSDYEVRVHAVPLLSTALNEPSAYELVLGPGADAGTTHAPDGGGSGPAAGR